MMMIVRDIIENLKKAGAKKPSNAVGRGVLSILRAMTYTPDNANYKNYKKYFPKTFNSKLTQKRVKQFHTQTDKVQLTMVKQAMNKVLGEGKLTEVSGVEKVLNMAKDHSFGKLGGKTIDAMSANLFKQVYEKTNDKTKEKINSMNEKQLYIFMTKLWSKFGKQVKI